MRVLAIDTSSSVLGVAVLDENGQGAEFNFNLGLRHASHLIPTIKKVLAFADLGLKDMDAYCVSIGPGSFTGLRIGVSTIKALWLVDRKKVAAVPTLDVLARNIADTDSVICVVVDAKKEKLYACFYKYKASTRSGNVSVIPAKAGIQNDSFMDSRLRGNDNIVATTPPLLLSYQDLINRLARIKNDILLVGDGIEKVQGSGFRDQGSGYQKIKFAGKDFWYPKAINVARIGIEMLKLGKLVKDVDALVPLYLHPRDVQCKK